MKKSGNGARYQNLAKDLLDFNSLRKKRSAAGNRLQQLDEQIRDAMRVLDM